MSWLSKLMPARIRTQSNAKRGVPEGLWEKCDSCGAALYAAELEQNLKVCPKCNHHMYIGARERLMSFLDEGEVYEIGDELGP
ncbi:MAG TPA: acetyl-CoA carboxylase carboxyl transferase subunit beta, partial [Arenimonas sp.]|nr:acetyl-CoA carboxylase carboxyl transferase subunit beta [Arenimonas sp.]